jgi:hypothetical protein
MDGSDRAASACGYRKSFSAASNVVGRLGLPHGRRRVYWDHRRVACAVGNFGARIRVWDARGRQVHRRWRNHRLDPGCPPQARCFGRGYRDSRGDRRHIDDQQGQRLLRVGVRTGSASSKHRLGTVAHRHQRSGAGDWWIAPSIRAAAKEDRRKGGSRTRRRGSGSVLTIESRRPDSNRGPLHYE